MMKKWFPVATTCFLQVSLYACTEFRVIAKDKSVVIGRSMEWGEDMHSRLIVQSRGKKYISTAPDGARGVEWQSQYGFVFVDAYGLEMPTDGMNEEGLSIGVLFFPSFGSFQNVPPKAMNKALASVDFVFWVLSNFSTVDQVRQAVKKIYVWGAPVDLPQIKNVVLPFHFGVYEATGKGIVIEYTKKGLTIFDNEVGVLTNAPTYDWHVTNLRNYVGLSSHQTELMKLGDFSLAPLGQGIGLRGIPGDFTPPSRFVRAATMQHLAYPAKTAQEAINLANHILYTVDIPRGTVKDATVRIQEYGDYSQWVVIKDLTNKQLYFRSYYNTTLRKIDLKKIDFSPKAQAVTLSLEEGAPAFIDVTDKLKYQSSSLNV